MVGKYATTMSFEMTMVIPRVFNMVVLLNEIQGKQCLSTLEALIRAYVKWRFIHICKLNTKVHLLTIVHRLQYPTLSSAGMSSSLDVVIKSSNSEMSLRSKVL